MFFHVMPQKKSRRLVPTYGMYRLEHEGEDALVVHLGHDDRNAPNRKAFRNAAPRSVDDSRLVQAFTALARSDVTLAHIAAFITKYGALGGLYDHLPPDLAKRFGQRKVVLNQAEANLFSGFGAPRNELRRRVESHNRRALSAHSGNFLTPSSSSIVACAIMTRFHGPDIH